MELHFVQGRECDLVLELVVSRWGKKQGQTNMGTGGCGRLVEREP